MKRTEWMLVTILVYAVGVCGIVFQSAEARPNAQADKLPEGPAKAIIVRSCTQCHQLSRITNNRKTEAGWEGIVSDMVKLGAQLKSDELKLVVSYLAKNFNIQSASAPTPAGGAKTPEGYSMGRGPANAGADQFARMLPDGEGKGLILASCVQCHNLRYLALMRKDGDRWKHTVDDMIARGAQLTVEEAEIVTQYLTQNLSKQ